MKKLILLFLVLMLVQPIFAVDNVEVIYTDAVSIDQHKKGVTEILQNIAVALSIILVTFATIFAIQGYSRHRLRRDGFGRHEPTQNSWAPRREQYNPIQKVKGTDINKNYYYY